MAEEVSNTEALAILGGLSEDEFVLHGSPNEYSLLTPQTPFQNPRWIEEYRRTAVHGTLVTEIALLYAVIHEPRNRWGWGVNEKYPPHLYVEGPKTMRGGKGFVHICPRKEFTEMVFGGVVCLSATPVEPIRVLCIQPTMLEELVRRERLEFQ